MWFFWRNIYTIWNERHSGWDSPSHLQRDSNLMLPLKPEEQGFPLLLSLLRIMQLVAGEVQHGKEGHSVQYWETSPCPLICPLLLSLSSLRRIAGIIAKTHLPMQWGWTWWALKVFHPKLLYNSIILHPAFLAYISNPSHTHTHISIASLAFCLHFFFFLLTFLQCAHLKAAFIQCSILTALEEKTTTTGWNSTSILKPFPPSSHYSLQSSSWMVGWKTGWGAWGPFSMACASGELFWSYTEATKV